ncbi:hypothetical protein TSUD_102450 [Trifolium subterraneum]|uniref:DUF1685 domain-containing protein n=1 Tax=Trifolium subterraneum TaxID=3900 RepID=A0A2Z6NBG5_TRISU|nr:hypothetical protein TSUD_102450 [Trifolium subterraneum]
MSAEQVLKLFDINWFETSIFTNNNKTLYSTSLLDSTSMSQVEEQLFLDTKLLRIPTLHVKSYSDENLGSKIGSFYDSLSPNSVLPTQKLKPILSGKEVEEFTLEKEPTCAKRVSRHTQGMRLRKGKKITRSLSELEFKELKGFMDLGYVFSEEDKDSTLVSLIPGLSKKEHNVDENVISRPYLSEAWGLRKQKKVVNKLINWRVPTLGNEIDMKDNLKFWAHTVASIVR